jgi:hypothetical protein
MVNTKSVLQFQYLRTTQLLKAETELNISESTKIRYFHHLEAAKFAETMRKSNMVARLGGLNNPYLTKSAELSNQTVIETYQVASPDKMLETGEHIALLIEKLAILSTTFVTLKKVLLRKLGISVNTSAEINFAVTNKFKTIRSRYKRAPSIEGIIINEQFCSRFIKCGFIELFEYLQSKGGLHDRVLTSANWLLESRREAEPKASVVKTAIALESLLIFTESESLARTLSERSAFILSSCPKVRHQISRIILRFYEVRSGIVHGSQKKAKKLTPTLTECVDRLTLLLHLIMASNNNIWSSVESLRLWCEEQRWGKPTSDVKFPLSNIYLKNALSLVTEEMKNS